jgi:hypothetical protein
MLRVAAMAAAAVLSVCAQSHPNFSGAWKLNESLSGTTAAGPREIVWKIEHNDPKLKYSASGVRGDMPFTEAFELTTDGKPRSDASRLAVTGEWEGEALVLRYVKDGRDLARFTLRVTTGGKQMTREGTLGSMKIREVYDRQ